MWFQTEFTARRLAISRVLAGRRRSGGPGDSNTPLISFSSKPSDMPGALSPSPGQRDTSSHFVVVLFPFAQSLVAQFQTGLIVSFVFTSLLLTINSECSGCAGPVLRRRNKPRKKPRSVPDSWMQTSVAEAVRACDVFRHRNVAAVFPSGIELLPLRKCVQSG